MPTPFCDEGGADAIVGSIKLGACRGFRLDDQHGGHELDSFGDGWMWVSLGPEPSSTQHIRLTHICSTQSAGAAKDHPGARRPVSALNEKASHLQRFLILAVFQLRSRYFQHLQAHTGLSFLQPTAPVADRQQARGGGKSYGERRCTTHGWAKDGGWGSGGRWFLEERVREKDWPISWSREQIRLFLLPESYPAAGSG